MSLADEIIDLLSWMKEKGWQPRRPRRTDLFINPITKTLESYDRMQPHQRTAALWVPNRSGLRELGLRTQTGREGPVTTIQTTCGRIHGSGKGETEALIALMHQVRHAA